MLQPAIITSTWPSQRLPTLLPSQSQTLRHKGSNALITTRQRDKRRLARVREANTPFTDADDWSGSNSVLNHAKHQARRTTAPQPVGEQRHFRTGHLIPDNIMNGMGARLLGEDGEADE